MEYKIVVVGGWCGNLLYIVAEHVKERLLKAGFLFDLITKNVWENYSDPPECNLILQLMPAYTKEDTQSPIINIRKLLVDRDDPETMDKIFHQVQKDLNSSPAQDHDR